MNEYVIFTDSGCDVPSELLLAWDIRSLSLTFRFAGTEEQYHDGKMDVQQFYNRMRAGETAKTSMVNVGEFISAFEEQLSLGKDILYIGFSSKLSGTYNSAVSAMNELRDKYGKRKLVAVDSLCASLGEGLLLSLVNEERKKGKTIDELKDYIQKIRLKVCHFFTVDDLAYLKRGGRISAGTAIIGNALGIKPILHVDNDGYLVKLKNVRGRKNSIATLFEMYLKYSEEDSRVFISHADALSDAIALADMIKEKRGRAVELISNVGSVIGAHSGPGTLALFFIGRNR